LVQAPVTLSLLYTGIHWMYDVSRSQQKVTNKLVMISSEYFLHNEAFYCLLCLVLRFPAWEMF